MGKIYANVIGAIILSFVAVVGLYASNPTTTHFRKVMKSQHSIVLDVASYLPIARQDYKLFSRFDVKYAIGKKTCYGAAGYIFVCPTGDTKNG